MAVIRRGLWSDEEGTGMELKVKQKHDLMRKKKCYAPWYEEGEVYLEQGGDMPLLRFRACRGQDWMQLAFSTRLGGVSSGHLSSCNLGWDRGDTQENVRENYRRVCRAMGADHSRIVLSDQVHGTTVCYVGQEHAGGEQIRKKLSGVDGICTDVPGLILATSYADCVPLFFFDPVRRIVAAAHSGWKGTVAQIGRKTVEKLREMGADPRDITAMIGPSICQECYEVSADVAEQFCQAYPAQEQEQILEKGRVTEQGEQKYQLDLWAANWLQLRRAGISPEQIRVSGACTCCNPDLLFSHRASHGKRGNLNGFIMIR